MVGTDIRISVVGLGYVGLPLALAFANNFSVVGFDVKEERIEQLKKGYDCSGELTREELLDSSVRINFTTKGDELSESNFFIICVPTPIDKYKRPDLSFIKSASEVVGKVLSKGAIVVYESTVYPGVTEDVCMSILEKFSGLKCGVDFKVGYSPERMNPGDKNHDLKSVVKIVAGMDAECLSIIDSVYSKITTTHRASSIKVGEAAKVIENIQRDLNIALMNELAVLFDKLSINIQDVLAAAGTKWNFHNYAPGLVGGHCFEKNSLVFLMKDGHQMIKSFGSYVDSLKCKKQICDDTEIFYPQNVNILSYDMVKNKTSFKPVTMASKRKSNEILNIKCVYNYNLGVTDRHPVIVYNKGLKVKFAKDLKVGDKLVLNKVLPAKKRNYNVDILEHLDKSMYNKIRVRIKGKKISDFREIINNHIKGKKGNYYRGNYLPLEKYLKIEKKIGVSRRNIYLCTGRGPCSKKFPCVIKIDNDFIRLIGYYLSEGCISKDKSLQTRFTFHREEREYQADVINILKKFCLDSSIYQDKTYQATVIKVSSFFFGFLLKDILRCGTNCYNMQIPDVFFDFNKAAKEELLKGLFRGDGGVTLYQGERKYVKQNKTYFHQNNHLNVNYFTSSKVLFQQVLLLLLNQNILPRLAKREGYLTLMGHEDINKVKKWFLGEKKEKIDSFLECKQKRTKYPYAKKEKHYIAINITDISRKKTDYVYSIEVDETHTLITSNGLIAHNCIGVDPYYLTHKAQAVGYHPEIILAGRRINDNMHKFYAQKVFKHLPRNLGGKVAKVYILGLTFKPNVADFRNSRVKHLIEELREFGVEVVAYDPYLEKSVVENHFGVPFVHPNVVGDIDLIVLAVEHQKLLGLLEQDVFSSKIIKLKEI